MIKRESLKKGSQVKVTFVLPHDPEQAAIAVVGDFNNWDPTATKLTKRGNNTRSASVTLDAGKKYAFRYRTADDVWFNDSDADGFEVGDHGAANCILLT